MKIAVQLFGHLRTYDQCYQSLFTNLLNLYDCDVFIHTWDKLDHNTPVWHNYHVTDLGQTKEELQCIIDRCYHPKSTKIETQIVHDLGVIDTDGAKISLFGIKSMIYAMQQANILREQYSRKYNVLYDFVVMCRPDIFLSSPLNIEKFIGTPPLPSKILYTAGHYKTNNIWLNDFRYIGGSDVLFFSRPDVMSEIFSHTDTLIEYIKNPVTSSYGPEFSIMCAIESLGIHPIFINYIWFKDFLIKRNEIPNKIKKRKKWKSLLSFLFTD